MGITMRRASAPLDAYIAHLWSSEGPPPYLRMAALPTPSLQLMVNFGATYHVYEASTERGEPCATCAESWAIGLRNRPYVMAWPCDLQLVTVSFRLGGASPFLRLPLAELRNQIVSLDAIWGALPPRSASASPTPRRQWRGWPCSSASCWNGSPGSARRRAGSILDSRRRAMPSPRSRGAAGRCRSARWLIA
jgi:hypothetical protein